MAEQHDLPSDSDESDVDFKLSDEESLPSEEESDGSVEEATLDSEEKPSDTSRRKRKSAQTKQRKKIKKRKHAEGDNENDLDNPEESSETKKLSPEEEKQRADALWNELMNDCPQPIPKSSSADPVKQSEEINVTKSPSIKLPVVEKENKAIVTEVYEFAGEKVTVQKEAPAQHSRGRGGLLAGRGRGRGRGGGIASIIGQLGKKSKLSTLEKSKLDWNSFKKEEGIEEDLESFNRGKEGYLERQDFLQRTDLRQFEIEKQLRTTSRSNR